MKATKGSPILPSPMFPFLVAECTEFSRQSADRIRTFSFPSTRTGVGGARSSGRQYADFSLDHDLDAIPGYDHGEPANAFPPLFDLITGLLEASLPSRVIALEMSRPDGQTWKASLTISACVKRPTFISLCARIFRPGRSPRNSCTLSGGFT